MSDAAGAGRPTCVYIASRGHSGSTLLEVLIGRHASVASAGEVAFLGVQCLGDDEVAWAGQCACGHRPFECPVWSEILARIERRYGIDMRAQPLAFHVSDVGLEEAYRRRGARARPHVWARNALLRVLRHQRYAGPALLSKLCSVCEPQREWATNRSFVLQSMAEVQNKTVVVDSSKDPLGMRDMYDFAPLPVKILFLTRDCRGNAWSFAKRNGYGERRDAQILRRAAREWVAVNSRIRKLLEGVARQDWLHVQYEELCRAPEATLQSIFEFIGLPNDPTVLEDRVHVAHTIAGNRIRLSNTRAAIHEDVAWREHLGEEEQRTIAAIAGPLARSLGYAV